MSIKNASIEEYRRQLEEEVAAKREAATTTAEVARPRGFSAAAPSAKEKSASLGRQAREDMEAGHEEPLARLADAGEEPAVRLAALQVLKLLAIASPTAPAWRPQFLAALREAVKEPRLRMAALEVLVQQRDRSTEELLLAGLEEPQRSLLERCRPFHDPCSHARDCPATAKEKPARASCRAHA